MRSPPAGERAWLQMPILSNFTIIYEANFMNTLKQIKQFAQATRIGSCPEGAIYVQRRNIAGKVRTGVGGRVNISKPNQSGIAVIFSMLLIGIILSIVFTLSLIFIPKTKSASDIKRSAAAAYAAESAIEWCLYINRQAPPSPVPTPPVLANGATFINGNTGVSFMPADCSVQPIKSVGTYQGVTRSFEVSF